MITANFVYDADGIRVKGTVAGVTTVYIAGIYEYQNGATTSFYEGGAIRRTGYATQNGVFFSLSDHLKSTSVLVNQDGTVASRNYYYPYGGNRGGSAFSDLTTKRFIPLRGTGVPLRGTWPANTTSRACRAAKGWRSTTRAGTCTRTGAKVQVYDAQVGVFISADTLVPSPLAPQTLNRFAYAAGNPLRWIDPTGHSVDCGLADSSCRLGGGGKSSGGSAYHGTYGVWKPPIKTWSSPPYTYRRPHSAPRVRSYVAPRATSVVRGARTPVSTRTPVVRPIAATARPIMRPGSTRTPTLTPTATSRPTLTPTASPTLQSGTVNGAALYTDWTWETAVEPLLEKMGAKSAIRASGRAMSAIPAIGVGVALAASVGPNLVTNLAEGAPRRKIVLDAATDALGVPASAVGGAGITWVGGSLELDPSDFGLPIVGGGLSSIAYDAWLAPRVYRALEARSSFLGW